MTMLDRVREKLQLLDNQSASAAEDGYSFRRQADEVIELCMHSASTASEPDRTRFWLCALQASDLSKNIAISTLAFSGGLNKATYALPTNLAHAGGIREMMPEKEQNRDINLTAWRKTFFSDLTTNQLLRFTRPLTHTTPDSRTEPTNPPDKVDWQDLLVLSFHLLGKNLLIFCVDKIEPFLDGYNEDYAFREERLPKDYHLAFEPIIIPDFYDRIPPPVLDMQQAIDAVTSSDKTQYKDIQKRFREALTVLGTYFGVKTILDKLKDVGIDTKKRILLLIPDKGLNQVPIHLLYTLFDGPLYKQFAGFAYSWDFISFKWRYYRRHINDERRIGCNKCVHFAVPGELNKSYLSGTAEEFKALQKAFGKNKVAVFGNKGPNECRSTVENFIIHHRDAEWLVFSGHGIDFRANVLLPSRQGRPFSQARTSVPNYGLIFEDQILSSVQIVATDCWNFSRSRLVLLNSCLLASLAGHETTHGIRTALYAKGATSVLGSQWPVYDKLCSVFIEEFTDAYLASVERSESFVLARALSTAMQGMEKYTDQKYGLDMSIMYGGYILDGLP